MAIIFIPFDFRILRIKELFFEIDIPNVFCDLNLKRASMIFSTTIYLTANTGIKKMKTR